MFTVRETPEVEDALAFLRALPGSFDASHFARTKILEEAAARGWKPEQPAGPPAPADDPQS